MRHLSRHITLNCGYFGYFRSKKYLPVVLGVLPERLPDAYADDVGTQGLDLCLSDCVWQVLHKQCPLVSLLCISNGSNLTNIGRSTQCYLDGECPFLDT